MEHTTCPEAVLDAEMLTSLQQTEAMGYSLLGFLGLAALPLLFGAALVAILYIAERFDRNQTPWH